jgi:hypothetical protein
VNVIDSNEWPRQEDQALRQMAERLEKELTVTRHLLKIVKLHQRTPWPGERTAAAEAFARVSRGTPWEGLTPEQFLRSARRSKPEPVKQRESEVQPQPRREQMDERHQDQHETVNECSKPRQPPASQNWDEAVNWRSRLVAFFVLAAITAGAALPHAPERKPPLAAQTPSSGPQTSVMPSDGIASLTPKKVTVAAVEPEQQPEAPLQTVTPVAPEVTPPALPAPLTPERQAEFIVYHLTAVENRGNVDDLSAYYSDTIVYYGRLTARSGVVADKTRFMRRWPNRKYTIRPESLTVACDIMRCTADGMIDFDVSNAGKRSIGSASFTYHLLVRHNNSEPPELLVTAENSIVVTRAVTDIGQLPVAAPQGRE